MGGYLVCFPVPGMWACCLVLFASPGCGVLLGYFVGCARMWVLGLFFWFDWLFVLVMPVCG